MQYFERGARAGGWQDNVAIPGPNSAMREGLPGRGTRLYPYGLHADTRANQYGRKQDECLPVTVRSETPRYGATDAHRVTKHRRFVERGIFKIASTGRAMTPCLPVTESRRGAHLLLLNIQQFPENNSVI